MFAFDLDIFSWSLKKQDIVAQSTTKVEYVATANVVNQAILVKKSVYKSKSRSNRDS